MMDVKNLYGDDLRALDTARRKELAKEMNQEMVSLRMDVYTPVGQVAGKLKKLRKNLARLFTVDREEQLKTASNK